MLDILTTAIATYDGGPKTSTFSVSSTTFEPGDQMLAIMGSALAEDAFATLPEGWELLVTEDTAGYRWKVFGKVATADDVGASIVWTGTGAIATTPVGVFLAFDGGVPSAPLVAGLDVESDQWGSATAHALTGAACSQHTDHRLMLWWLFSDTPTVTVPTGDHIEELLNETDAAYGRLTMIDETYTSLGLTTDRDLVSNVNVTGVGVSLGLRTRVLLDRAGVTDPDPGRVGILP